MSDSPLQYTDRTYNTIINSINAIPELADKPEWFKRYIAGLGDTFSVIIDAIANDSLLPTALTRESTQFLLKLIDYELAPPETSNGTQIFNVKPTTTTPTNFSATDLLASTQGSLTVSSKKYASRDSVSYSKQISNFTRSNATQFNTAFDFRYTGKKVQLITTGTLPAGLSLNTDYYIVYISNTLFSLATNVNNAFNNILVSTTDVGTGTHTVELISFEATLYQQEQKNTVVVGTSDGITGFQEFTLPDSNIIIDTLIITIASVVWTLVDTLVESSSTEKVFRILTKSENNIAIQFGNNEFGAIPPSADIEALYSVGGGSSSNTTVLNSINVYSASNSEITSTANPTVYSGGADEESIENAKIIAPLLLKARNRFVTTTDGEVIAFQTGGLSLVKINRNAFGVLTAQVLGIANGGGNPSALKKTEVENELVNKSVLESITVSFDNATLSPPTVTANVKILPGFTFSTVSARITLGIKLFYTETGTEILQKYISSGITDTISLINTIFSESFTASDAVWIEPLVENLIPVNFGITINESDIVSYIKSNIAGIDDLIFTAPAFPIILLIDETTTHTGISIGLTEIF